jgi:putative FmdB family regulatory protein
VPIYDYKCDKCRAEFQRNESISAHGRKPVSCPKCKSSSVSQIITPSYVKTVKKS